MKKYMIICIIVVVFLLGFYYLNNYTSFNLFSKSKVTTFIKTDNRQIVLNNDEFEIKAINFGAYSHNYDEGSSSIDYDTYQKWFKQISDLGKLLYEKKHLKSSEILEVIQHA